MRPRFAPLVDRIAYEGTDPWVMHWVAKQAAARGEDVIVLSVGDPDLETPAAVVDTAVARMRAGDTHYTESAGREHLRAAIAAAHAKRTGQPVAAENAIFLSGAQNGLFVATQCLAGVGDEVIAIDPMYTTYPPTVRASGATLVRVRAPAETGFRPDLAAIEAAITPRTRAVLLATPNNPTGVILNDAEADGLAEIARRHGIWIVSDEVYAGIADGGHVPSLAARLPDQVLTIGSLSKTHAMTGWRAGWIVGPTDFIRHAENLASAMLYGLPGFVQEAAVAALGIAPESEATMREYCNVRRDVFHRSLAGIPGVQALRPEAGMFMLIDVRGTGLATDEFVRRFYEAERVSVLDGEAFGPGAAGFVRVCFASEEPILLDAAARLRRFCESLARVR